MKRIFAFLIAISIWISMSANGSASLVATPTEPAGRGERVTVIVEVKGDAVLETREAVQKGASEYATTKAAKRQEESNLRTQATVQENIEETISSDVEVGYTYTYLLNGFSMEVNEGDIDAIRALPGVEDVWIAEDILLDDPIPGTQEEIQLAVDNCCQMMGVDAAHAAGYRGEGMAIAVIDSEFDVGHEFFATVPDDLSKVKYTKADIGTLIQEQNLNMAVSANQVYRSAKIPYAYNYAAKNADTYSNNQQGWHGTHVAGIAAGKNGELPDGTSFDGVAPEAQLVLMCVSNNGGRTINSAASAAAIDDAAKLGVDAINLSFGSPYDYNNPTQTRVVNAAQNAGIFVAASAGNYGRGNDMKKSVPVTMIDYATSGTPANAAGATGVASANNTGVWQNGATVTLPGGTPIFVRDVRNFLATFPVGSELSYTYYGQGTTADFEGVDASGKIAVILRGNGSFNDKVSRAAAANAEGVILVNNADTDANPMVTVEETMPVGWINHHSDGAALLQNTSGTFTVGTGVELRSAQAGVSNFSSWGTNASLNLKPEIMTPGSGIFSSYPNDQYTLLSGTSMAAPHATGCAALLAQYIHTEFPDYTGNRAALVENLMMSTATQVMQSGTNLPYSPRAQGAGLVNLAAAMETPVILQGTAGKSKLNLGEIGNSFTLSFDAVNLSDAAAVYDEVAVSVITDDYTTEDGVNVVAGSRNMAHTLSGVPSSVSVAANGSQSVSVTVTLDATDLAANEAIFTNGFFVEGYVTLSDSNDTLPDVHIPYMGFYGGWEKAPIFDPIDGISGKTTVTVPLDANTSVRLGQNPVLEWMKKNDASGYATYEATAEQYEGTTYAAWSPNGDGCMDTIAAKIFYLRTATGVVVQVSDGQNPEQTAAVLNGQKEKYNEYGFILNGTADEGEYTFTVKGRVVGTGQSLPAQSFPLATLTCDVTPPEVTDYAVTSENGVDTLSLSLSDNNYISGVIVSGEDANETEITRYYPLLPEDEATLSLDVSDIEPSTLTVAAYDYAGNAQVLEYGIAVTDKTVTDLENGTSEHTFAVLNTTGTTPSAWCALALYDGNKMVGIQRKTVTVEEGVGTLSFTLPNVSYDTKKVFVWNGADEMIPIGTYASR